MYIVRRVGYDATLLKESPKERAPVWSIKIDIKEKMKKKNVRILHISKYFAPQTPILKGLQIG
jgi:hypothetical protein